MHSLSMIALDGTWSPTGIEIVGMATKFQRRVGGRRRGPYLKS
jgi:hypothetical protein